MNKRKYAVCFYEMDYNLVVNVKDDDDQPNREYCEKVLLSWLVGNYGSNPFKYFEIDNTPIEEIESPFDWEYVKMYGLPL